MTHRKLNDKIKRAINGRIKDGHTEDEIKQAILNYAIILQSDEYYFKHTWTLQDFLNRGLEKFADLEIAKKNYRKDGRDGGTKKPGTIKGDPGKYQERDTQIDSAS